MPVRGTCSMGLRGTMNGWKNVQRRNRIRAGAKSRNEVSEFSRMRKNTCKNAILNIVDQRLVADWNII